MADDVDDGESERKNKVCVLVWVLVLNKVQLTKQLLFVGIMCSKILESCLALSGKFRLAEHGLIDVDFRAIKI